MNAMSPLDMLKNVVATIEHERDLRNRIDRVRTIEESTMRTLERVLEERKEIVNLLQQLKVPHESFDFDYKENLVTVLRSLLAPHLAVANATKR